MASVGRHNDSTLRDGLSCNQHITIDACFRGSYSTRFSELGPKSGCGSPCRRRHRYIAKLPRQLVETSETATRIDPKEFSPELIVGYLGQQGLMHRDGALEPSPHIVVLARVTDLSEDRCVQ
jgi:hypothetical protein